MENVTTENERVEALNLEWFPFVRGERPLWGMICKDGNNNYYIIGDAIEGGDDWAYDSGCGCCSGSYGVEKSNIMLKEYAWLVPVSKIHQGAV